MTKQKIQNQIAKLESVNDQLLTELAVLDALLIKSGFPYGLTSLKQVALEILDEQKAKSPKANDE